jgi:DNA-directed RNA polymerase specialized sigma24 family protein
LWRDDRAERIEEAVCALPPRLRQVVLARYLDNTADAVKHQLLRVSSRTYRNCLNLAHRWLDDRLKRKTHPRA